MEFYSSTCSKGTKSSWLFSLFVIVATTMNVVSPTRTSTGTCSATIKFNDQLMPRVIERLDDFLRRPVEATMDLVNFHSISGFRSATDRGSIAQHMIANSITDRASRYPLERFVVLEDGVHVFLTAVKGVDEFNEYITYREPGNSGYVINKNDSISVNDPNYKYWKSCFNTSDGTPADCLMSEGEKYVECINDCELIPCRNITNNNDTTIEGPTKNTNATLWCKNYVLKEVDNLTQRGYIPVVDLCIDQVGKPEQRQGYVLSNVTSQELGDCTFMDGVTLVNNTLVGDYEVCGGNGTVCDWAFHGAQYQWEYDARATTVWYPRMRERQVADWSDPVFYHASTTLAISYEHPLYKSINESPKINTTKKIFDGVVTVDYNLVAIGNFLRESFSGSAIQVIVFEPLEPYYIVASSNQDVALVKFVLLADETKLCPVQYFLRDDEIDEEMCSKVRLSMNELQNVDIVLYRSFMAHVEKGLPTTAMVNVKKSNVIGSLAYATQGKEYRLPQSDTVSWHVVAVLPMSRATNDSAVPGDITFSLLCFFGILGFLGCLLLFVKFFSRRTERAMVQADWRFTCAFILGCAILNLSTFTLLGPNTDPICMLRMWSFNGLFTCALSPLFVKVYRMATLLNAGSRMQRVAITNVTAFIYTLPLVVTQLGILLIFSIVDPPRQTEQLGVGEGIGVQQITCEQQTSAFFITQVVFDGFLVLVGCVLAYQTRDMDRKYGEAKQLGFSMYNIAFTGMVCILTMNIVELDQLSKKMLQAIGVFWASFFCSLSFVLPRLLEAANQRKQSIVNSTNNGSYSGDAIQSSGLVGPSSGDAIQLSGLGDPSSGDAIQLLGLGDPSSSADWKRGNDADNTMEVKEVVDIVLPPIIERR